MHKIAVLVFLLAGLGRPLWAQTENAPAVQSTIQSQIDAFLADDFAAAFEFASPGIRRMFGSVENFEQMVKRGYPMVWRPEELRFLELREIEGALWQKVLIRDRDGQTHALMYRMERGPDGWRIAGVQVLQTPGVAA